MASKKTDEQVLREIEEEVEQMVHTSLGKAAKILNLVVDKEEPFPGFVTMTLALAVLAKAMDMPRHTLLEGVGAAFDSVQEAGHHGTH